MLGRVGRRRDRLRKLRRIGVEIRPTDLSAEMKVGPRQHIGRARIKRDFDFVVAGGLGLGHRYVLTSDGPREAGSGKQSRQSGRGPM